MNDSTSKARESYATITDEVIEHLKPRPLRYYGEIALIPPTGGRFNGERFTSIARLAKSTGASLQTVSRAVNELIDARIEGEPIVEVQRVRVGRERLLKIRLVRKLRGQRAQVPAIFHTDTTLSPTDYAIYVLLLCKAGSRGCFPFRRTLGKDVGISRSRVSGHLARLSAPSAVAPNGWITRRSRTGTSNMYSFVEVAPAAPSAVEPATAEAQTARVPRQKEPRVVESAATEPVVDLTDDGFVDVLSGDGDVPTIGEALTIASRVRCGLGAGYRVTPAELTGARRLRSKENSLGRPLAVRELTLMLIFASRHRYFGTRANSLAGLPEHTGEIFFSSEFRAYVAEESPADLVRLPPELPEQKKVAPLRGQLAADTTGDPVGWGGAL